MVTVRNVSGVLMVILLLLTGWLYVTGEFKFDEHASSHHSEGSPITNYDDTFGYATGTSKLGADNVPDSNLQICDQRRDSLNAVIVVKDGNGSSMSKADPNGADPGCGNLDTDRNWSVHYTVVGQDWSYGSRHGG